MDYIKETPLDANYPVQMGTAHIGGDYVLAPVKDASVTGPTGEIETTASEENLSAKFKYPNVSQDTVAEDLLTK